MSSVGLVVILKVTIITLTVNNLFVDESNILRDRHRSATLSSLQNYWEKLRI